MVIACLNIVFEYVARSAILPLAANPFQGLRNFCLACHARLLQQAGINSTDIAFCLSCTQHFSRIELE